MKLFVSLLLLFLYALQADTQLKSNYFINSKTVKLSDITGKPTHDSRLYTISKQRHSKRVKSKELLQKLQKLGFKEFSSSHSYIQFTQKSPIDTSIMVEKIKEHYKQNYNEIAIVKIDVYPRSYLLALPQKYTVVIDKKSYLKNRGTIYIKTFDNKKIFFNYKLEAMINVFVAKNDIKKDDALSTLNLQKKSIMLDKFRAMPLKKLNKATTQAKYKIKKGSVITLRNIAPLILVKRGSFVNVTIKNSSISISFSAKANQSGRYGQGIYVTNSNGKRLKAVVTGRNTAEIR